jgi:glucose-6-phosphate 1-dehydrogenase
MHDTARNPLTLGLAKAQLPQPCAVVIFGGAGDLARRKLLPALYNLRLDGVLPANFAIVGFARTELDDAGYRQMAAEAIHKFSRRPLDAAQWGALEGAIFYVRGAYDDPASYDALRQRLSQIEPARGIPGNHLYYLSTPPSLIDACATHLSAAGLIAPADGSGPFSRIIVEKPIGHDLESAREINATLSRVFDESQVFRIDHYLGKETVQNVLVMRFANSIFEPLWNQRYIDHVQITVAEEEGVGTRAGYYEGAGALRDMVQNHILQLLCVTAMEPPSALAEAVIRDHKQEVLNCLRPLRGAEVERHVVRAQYAAGAHRGIEVPGYRSEPGITPDSTTESYVALKVFIDNWRWSGVPFYLRTGKRLPKRASEIAVQFKNVPPILFNTDPNTPVEPTVLVLRLQPDEGLSLRISAKVPGAQLQIYPVRMDFRYGTTFGDQAPEAYERLLLDVMAGDATLFMRRDAIETSWGWITDILDAWAQSGARWLPQYAAGTWGPVEADRLIATGGRRWRTL